MKIVLISVIALIVIDSAIKAYIKTKKQYNNDVIDTWIENRDDNKPF